MKPNELRTLVLASLGGALEFYDFVVFVFFTGVIGRLFFPPALPDWLRQLQTFGIFAAGYLARPLGGIVMAHFGDRRGRKQVFILSVLLMAFSTLLIGLLPTYRTIGSAAPLLLLTMRVLQGIAIGGEAPGGWVFVAEHAAPSRLGFAIGLLTSGLTFGILLGSLMATGLNLAFNPTQIAAGLWRVPFLTGGIFGIASALLRRWLSETPVFKEMMRKASVSRELPLRMALRHHRSAVAVSMAATWMLTAAIVVLILMTPSLLQASFKLPQSQVQLANLAATAALSLSVIAVGMLTDRFGTRQIAIPALLLLIVAACALYTGVAAHPLAVLPLYVLVGIATGGIVVTPIIMVRAFPTPVRLSGVSFSYNVIYALFGGITPPLVVWLAHLNRMSPALYVAAATLVGLAAAVLAPVAPSLK